MNLNRISVRYAKALFQTALEENKAEKIHHDMQLIFSVSDEPEFRTFLENPVIYASKKQNAFNAIFGNKVDSLTVNFFKLLSDKRRELYLKAIARNFGVFYRQHFNIKSVELVTPYQADEKLKAEISNIVATGFKTQVEMTDKYDPAIVGGFVLTVEGLQYDASVASKLKLIKKELLHKN